MVQGWGSLGIVLISRAKKFEFDRKKLHGSTSGMSKFSLGMSLLQIEKELSSAINKSLYEQKVSPHVAYECLLMLDKILPPNLHRLMMICEKYLSFTRQT